MLKITNMTWTHDKFTKINALANIITKKLKNELRLKVFVLIENECLSFTEVEPRRLMLSYVTNKIPLKSTDQRIKKLNRDYLETYKPTKKQYEGFFETVNNYLDDLGLSAKVELITKDSTYVLREGKNKITNVPMLNTYPVEK